MLPREQHRKEQVEDAIVHKLTTAANAAESAKDWLGQAREDQTVGTSPWRYDLGEAKTELETAVKDIDRAIELASELGA